LTTEIECQGVSSGVQAHEVQEITISADTMLSGEMTLTYTDAYGQAWTTNAIAVGGDNKFDLRLSATDNSACTFNYVDAEDSPAQFSDGKAATVTDFAGRLHQSPAISNADVFESALCNAATAAEMDAIISHNSAVRNVQVTKSNDVTVGAKFEITIGDFNAQVTNTAGEIGTFSIVAAGAAEGVTSGTVHNLGDHSEDIARALTSLPYNVIPSVTVSKQDILSSDYATADVATGNGIQQKYRVTFSDAANAGDQNLLQCNAEACNEDGCAPRFSGVNHEKYISTTNHFDDKIADYKTSIVATGQGGFWLRSYKARRYSVTTFTSGNYYIHRDLGNGKTSSATFQFNDDQAAIQSALQTIEGWDGVSVACNSNADSYAKGKGTPGVSGHSTSQHGLECYVTYAVGYDDGARLPTMTYDNFNGANIANLAGMECKNEVCAVTPADLGTSGIENFFIGAGAATGSTQPRYENNNGYVYITAKSGMQQACVFQSAFNSATNSAVGSTVTQASSGAVGTLAATANSATQTFIVTNGIAFDSAGPIVINGAAPESVNPTCAAAQTAKFSTGTYEIIRTTTYAATGNLQFLLFAPGQADCASYYDCFDPLQMGATFGQIHDTTPLMPMWPSISNSIALHDTTLRVVLDAGTGTGVEKCDSTCLTTALWNIGYGSLGYSSSMIFKAASTCEDVQAELIKFKDASGSAGFSTTGTPYPSLIDPNDATKSICDCHKMDSIDLGTQSIMWDITCPAYIANHLWITSESRSVIKKSGGTTEKAFLSYTYVRQTPPSGIDTKVAVGDTLTVLSSVANTNKQYTVKAIVDDGRWGTGQANIWSTAAGYLGKDDPTNGMVHSTAVVLDTKMNYRAYGDFVKFLKVDPAPSADYQITELKTMGQNSTTFTRTLESISTTTYSVAELTFYDTGDGDSSQDGGTNVAALSGTFQLIYDGQTTVAMQALVSKEGMMEALASLSNIDHVPTVTGGVATAGAASVSWQITFNAKSGDAKKLTFKYTDTIGNERQESEVISSQGTAALTNTVATITEGTNYAVNAQRDIVMKYIQEGSTFFDKLDTTATTVHDELAADVTVGSTFTVASSEVINYYLFQETGTVTAGAAADICAAQGSALSPEIIFEFNGQMSLSLAMCASPTAFSADSVFTNGIQTLTGLSTASCALTTTVTASGAVNTAFDEAFPWGVNHMGTAVVKLACTLPLGTDGASFKVHSMLNQQTGWNLGVAIAATVHAGQAYQHRAQNNNGRTFTVTQAYENKISEMTHFSRLPAATSDATQGTLASAYGLLSSASFDDTEIVVGTVGNFNPGTYYNVKLFPTGTQTPAFAKVVVGHATIISIEIVSGGLAADPLNSGAAAQHIYHIKCDTRIHSTLTCDAHTSTVTASTGKKIVVTLGVGTTHVGFNFITSSLEIGSDSSAVANDAGFCASTSTGTTFRRNVAGLCKDAATGLATHTTNVVLDCECLVAALVGCKIVAGGSGTKTAIDTAANLQGNVDCVLSGNVATGANAAATATFAGAVNSFAYVAGFYDTGTPKLFVDALHEGVKNGELLQGSQSLTIMGGISGISNYYYKGKAGVNEVQMYSDLESVGSQGGGLGRKDRALAPTASVLAGRGAARIPDLEFLAVNTATKAHPFFSEHAQKYQYAGRGFDQLTVTPTPDLMADQKVVITYNGAAGACSVAEVDRGTHESSVCSGRGNCDHASGTCVCDLGYTLEACSEQTVLV